LPRGALTEIFGPASSGRTSMILAALGDATRRQEVCALVDAGDSLHPESAAAAGRDLRRLLWIRCDQNPPHRHRDTAIDGLKSDDCRLKSHQPTSSPWIKADQRGSGSIHNSSIHQQSSAWDRRLTQVLKTTDLLLQSGGFGIVVVDLADVPPRFARRIPLASWFRFRRAAENTPTVLLVVEQEPYAKACASLVLRMQQKQHSALSTQHSASHGWKVNRERSRFTQDVLPAHAQLLRELPVEAEIVHARLQRKPAQSVTARFSMCASWANFAG
jgi:hypothetical protein